MFRQLQRLQRRAIVVLAWLVLALAVAPAASESLRPLAVYAAASSLSVAGDLRGGIRSVRAIGGAHGAPAGRNGASTQAAAAASSARRAGLAFDVARSPSIAVEPLPPPRSCRSGARDERHLYLSLCRLSC